MKGLEFKAMLGKHPDVKVVSEWHYQYVDKEKTVWNLYFNQYGRMKFNRLGGDFRYIGTSPEEFMRFTGLAFHDSDHADEQAQERRRLAAESEQRSE